MPVPIIDLFAGPGGLSEGFNSFETSTGLRPFRVRLSIEKEPIPHRTLELRAFFRQFASGHAPTAYYDYVRGGIEREELFALYPAAAAAAQNEAWCAELGVTPHHEVVERIRCAMRADCRKWVLIGGPPCQAYSLVGRSRRKNDAEFAGDERHFLYRKYLQIIAERQPAVFVMENVQGILSSRAENEGIFERIVRDLRRPRAALQMKAPDVLQYHLYPLNAAADQDAPRLPFGESLADAKSFVVRSERYGIPQARPRVFVLGVRADIARTPRHLQYAVGEIPNVRQAIGDLPKLRSRISRAVDSPAAWSQHIQAIGDQVWLRAGDLAPRLRHEICRTTPLLNATRSYGAAWLRQDAKPSWNAEWYGDERLGGICHHEARGHMSSDLWRYFFAAVFARVEGRSPLLRDFPRALLPLHDNVQRAVDNNDLFSDRFRVQLRDRPATTVVSHISKDGHYYIHFDPLQCRSLTVREAARLQTFKDNYFFEGPRTAQYHQVGNAVPPLLARQIAAIVYEVLR